MGNTRSSNTKSTRVSVEIATKIADEVEKVSRVRIESCNNITGSKKVHENN